jgi:exopolysaccharide biosynthesis polyprenyl glycosylphosphotransferase
MTQAIRARPAGFPSAARQVPERIALSYTVERVILVAADATALTFTQIVLLDYGAAGRATTAACVVGALFTLLCLGMYRSRLQLSVLDDVPRLAVGGVTGSAMALAVLWAVDGPLARTGLLGQTLLTAAVATIAGRACGYAVVRAERAHRSGRPTLIVGAGAVAADLARILLADRRYGLTPTGQVTSGQPTEVSPIPVLGDTDQLPSLLGQMPVSHILVAFSAQHEAGLIDALRRCHNSSADVLCVPRLYEVHPRASAAEQVGPIPLMRLCRTDRSSLARTVKRMFDVVVAGSALLLLAPVFAVCAVAVWLEGGPGVVFRQERVGRGGIPFTLLKFRSLRPSTAQESATLWSVADDRRVGPIGRLIRKTSLDELPQLVNILRGEMSLVGPRPERPHFVAEFSRQYADYLRRHRAEMGLTGWAQVNGLRGATSIADRVLLDNWYIEHWSLWLDIKILLLTVGAVSRELCGARR